VTTKSIANTAFKLCAHCVLLFVCAAATAQKCAIYDTVYYNGNILTGGDLLNTMQPPERVHALAIVGGHIVAAPITPAMDFTDRGCVHEAIDLHGAFVMPGFNDAHTHMASAGQQRLAVDLDNVPTLAAKQAKIKAYAAKLPPGGWILGGGWDHTKWPSKTLPTRQDLDAVTAGHPAYLERTDGHIAIANTAALAAAGLTPATPDPMGGKLDRDAHGNLTGILREASTLALMQAHIPPPTHDVRQQALLLAIDDALAHGVTSVQDFSDWDDWLVLEELEHAGKLKLRIAEWMAFDLPLETLKSRRTSHDPNDPRLHLAQLKAFMDGSLGSRTATLAAPYADDPQNSGLPRYDQDTLNKMADDRAEEDFQLGFHAIGDRANTMALDAFENAAVVRQNLFILRARAISRQTRAKQDEGWPAREAAKARASMRFRIEHAQVVTPDAFQRFHDLGVIASMQPSHLLTDMAWAGDRLGPERVKYAYAWKSFLDHGVTLAFGTDYPVESINPFRGLYSAITRMNEAGTQTFQPQERITLNQALYAYTQASAFSEFRETTKGKLAPGYLADFVVLDRDITKATPQELLHTKVLRTVVNGETVYIASATAPATTAP
jgi:predicted amidohydrolase YtcJ